MQFSFEHHPLNVHMTIDFSTNIPVYSLTIPFDKSRVTKAITSVASTDWHGAWAEAKDIVVEFMNNLYADADDNVQEESDPFPFEIGNRSLANSKAEEIVPLFMSFDEGPRAVPSSDSVDAEFDPIRIYRSGDDSIYYELNGIGAFFYCTFKCCGILVKACLGYAEYMDWETARCVKEKLIIYFSLYYKEVLGNYLSDALRGRFVALNFGDCQVFMYKAAELHLEHISEFEELTEIETGVC